MHFTGIHPGLLPFICRGSEYQQAGRVNNKSTEKEETRL